MRIAVKIVNRDLLKLDFLLSNMQSYVGDVKLWMMQNKLQLNEGKTEVLLIDPQNSPNLPLSITIGQNETTS